MNKGAIARIIDFSAVDGPGNRMVVFFQGCNFNCLYCHNPETIVLAGAAEENPEYPAVYREMALMEILARYRKAKPFISGITFSGGECTLQFEFLMSVCTALKEQEKAHILIDTNGQISGERLEQLLTVVDGLMIDVKSVDPDRHRFLTGVGNEQVIRSFRQALSAGKLAEVRTVILGNETAGGETVRWVAQELAAVDATVPYRTIRYRLHGVRKEMVPLLKPPSDVQMVHCKALAEAAGLMNVIVV